MDLSVGACFKHVAPDVIRHPLYIVFTFSTARRFARSCLGSGPDFGDIPSPHGHILASLTPRSDDG